MQKATKSIIGFTPRFDEASTEKLCSCFFCYREALSLHEAARAYTEKIDTSSGEAALLARMLYADALGTAGDIKRACEVGLKMFVENKS